MFFRSPKYKEETVSLPLPAQNNFLVWLEIGVTDMERAAEFYQKVFNIHIEILYLFDRKIGVFKKEGSAAGVCIIERDAINKCNSVKPTFFVNVIYETVEKIMINGGVVTLQPLLLKQRNQKGETLIGSTLIDDHVGYMAEFTDTEGNSILLYSHC